MSSEPANGAAASPSAESSSAAPPRDMGLPPDDPADDTGPRPPLQELGVLLALVLVLVADLIADAVGTSAVHVAIEVIATGLALAAAVRVWMRWTASRRALERRVRELGGQLRIATADAERWRSEAREALEGLGAAIDRQCDRWSLTEAEREVAMLSMKEIADARGTVERTARQQALSVYKKAGLGGRAELSAFFLEDLLLPSSRASRS